MIKYKLRTAKNKDLKFLFEVSTRAMLPIRKINQPNLQLNLEKEFEVYTKKFEPAKIQVIQMNGRDIGRLRIVRTQEEIYVGGIQILPKWQKKRIGSAIFSDLIKEANKSQLPIMLEVAKVNKIAKRFYERLGFKKVGEKETDLIMKYKPDKQT